MARKTFDSLLTSAGFETYEDLADKAGVSRHTLWRWRNGSPPKRRSALVGLVAKKLKTDQKTLLRILAA